MLCALIAALLGVGAQLKKGHLVVHSSEVGMLLSCY